nr:hypothetical protein [Tanacetum cinerariifolium]
ICTKLSNGILSLEQIKTNQAAKIKKLKQRVKKLEGEKKKRTHGLKRLYKVGLTARVESSKEEEEQDATVTEKEVSAAVDEVVTTAKSVEGIIAATTPQISKDDAKDKGKGFMVEHEKPLKKKDQIAFDEEVVRKLEAQMKSKMEEEERIAREKDEANIAVIEEWDDVQATIDTDRQLAEQLQTQERERRSIEERSKLLAELIKYKRKYFAAKRAEEIRNKPPTKAQQKSLMYTYMKIWRDISKRNSREKSLTPSRKCLTKFTRE